MARVLGQRWRAGAEAASNTWFSLQGLVLGQSVARQYAGMAMRVFLSLWLLCCLVLGTAYTCNLVAILSSPPDPRRIHSLVQLAESDFRLATVDYGDFLYELLGKSEDGIVKQLKQKLDFFPDEAAAVASMADDSHVLLGVKIETQYMVQEKFRMYRWYLLPELLFTNYLCWLFPKNVPWKKKFDTSIQSILEAGLYNQWLKVEMEKVSNAWRRHGGSSTWYAAPLNLPNLQGVFYLLFIGFLISGTVFICEYTWSEKSFAFC